MNRPQTQPAKLGPLLAVLGLLLAMWFGLAPKASAALLPQDHSDLFAADSSPAEHQETDALPPKNRVWENFENPNEITPADEVNSLQLRWESRFGELELASGVLSYADGNPISKFDPFGLATVGVGLQAGGGLGLGITLSAGVYVGKSGWNPLTGWSSGLLFSGGGGIEAGAGGSGAIFAQVTDAPNVNNLKGPGFEVGASGGELLVGGIDYVGGLGNTNGNNFPVNTTTFKGVSLNLGVGGETPLEGHANVTGTAGWTTTPWSSSAPTSSAPSSHNPFKPTIGPQLNSYGGSKSCNK